MQLTVFLGQIIGIFWTVMGIAIIVHYQRFKKIFTEILDKPSLLAISGFLSLIIGSILVVTHNIWEMNFQGLITLIGWLILAQALIRLLFPVSIAKKCKGMIQNNCLLVIGWIVLIVGLFIGYMSFYHIPMISY